MKPYSGGGTGLSLPPEKKWLFSGRGGIHITVFALYLNTFRPPALKKGPDVLDSNPIMKRIYTLDNTKITRY